MVPSRQKQLTKCRRKFSRTGYCCADLGLPLESLDPFWKTSTAVRQCLQTLVTVWFTLIITSGTGSYRGGYIYTELLKKGESPWHHPINLFDFGLLSVQFSIMFVNKRVTVPLNFLKGYLGDVETKQDCAFTFGVGPNPKISANPKPSQNLEAP